MHRIIYAVKMLHQILKNDNVKIGSGRFIKRDGKRGKEN